MNEKNNQTKQLKPWQGILSGILATIMGIGLLIYSLSSIKDYNEKNKSYTEINSVVVDYAKDDEGLEAIIVEYKVNGQTYKKQSDSYSNIPKSIGTEVKIKYNPNNPSESIWVNDSRNIIVPFVGGVFAISGIFIIINHTKRIKTDNKI